jgi:D-tyrosyl-tRNA(Tyr) deacylase
MRAVIQVVKEAAVSVDGETVGRIGSGFLVLLAVQANDTPDKPELMAKKIADLRILPDAAGKMNLDLATAGGELLIVSQFTLYGDATKGNRPSFIAAASGAKAEPYYEKVVSLLKDKGFTVATGRFGAMMEVSLVNMGPTTIIIDL